MKRRWGFVLASGLLSIPVLLFAQRGYLERTEERFTAQPGRSLEVILDIDAGELIVERGNDPREGEVRIRYAEDEYSERVSFREENNRLKLEMKKRRWASYSDKDNDFAEIIVTLPYDVDILFDSRIKAGEVQMDMGGMRLKEFSLNNWAGEVEIRFSEPNRIPMEYFDVNAKVGELRIVELGNARFRSADINGGIGEIDIDFTGDLEPDSRAKVDLDIGEASILLPRAFGVRMSIGGGFSFLSHKDIDHDFVKRGSVYYNDNYDLAGDKFSLRVTPGLGELRVDVE